MARRNPGRNRDRIGGSAFNDGFDMLPPEDDEAGGDDAFDDDPFVEELTRRRKGLSRMLSEAMDADEGSIESTIRINGLMEKYFAVKFQESEHKSSLSEGREALAYSKMALEYAKQTEAHGQRKSAAITKRKEDLLPKLIRMMEDQEEKRRKLSAMKRR